ncbi:hypothetical protein VFC49_04225 [Thermococcus sp. SY098]|uniref:hypothetical protein n=1 Tax=Thermococcus sp. SY098 TaxID=3111325 RepID=UPI002D78F5AE|nr:hypothetical protein [Thermococcus sp. SY098]WRS53328.1 hypothetical protein VFC49_04225 [Thermococcus sp. SY098]
MRKVFFAVVIFLISLPQTIADSVFYGWVQIPTTIMIGSTQIMLKDISGADGSIFVVFKDDKDSNIEILPLSNYIHWEEYNLSSEYVLLNEKGYAKLKLNFPYLLEGETMRFGDYKIYLKSVTKKQAQLELSYKNITKEFTYKGGEINFEDLKLSLILAPTIFDGYISRGYPKKIGEWSITFVSYNITKEDGTLKEIVELKINKKTYWSEVGDVLDAEGLRIEIKDLVGSTYLRMEVEIKGAYLNISLTPYFESWLSEGKTTKIGSYIVKIEKIFSDQAYVSIKNPCGMPLKSGLVKIDKFSRMLSYDGISVGFIETKEENGEKKVKTVIIIDNEKIPKIEDVAFLNVSYEVPAKITQYSTFETKVILENTGKGDLRYVEILPNLSKIFSIVNDYPRYIPTIKRGEKIELTLVLQSQAYGNLTVGNIRVLAHAPYELSCYGLGEVEFSSERKRVEILKAEPNYSIDVKTLNGTVGSPIPLNITIANLGNVDSPFDLTVALPKEFGVVAENFTIYGKWLHLRDTLKPGTSKTYKMFLISTKEGQYEVEVLVKSFGKLFQKSTTLTVTSLVKEHTENILLNQNVTCTPKVIERVVEVPKIIQQNNTVTVEAVSLKWKIVYGGGFFVGGVIFILALAWIAAKLEERKER